MAATYEAIATQTLGSAAATITFSSIAASWTDLRLVLSGVTDGSGKAIRFRYNGDTNINYSYTNIAGNGSSAYSNRAGASYILTNDGTSTTAPSLIEIDIFSYASSTYKTCLCTGSEDQNGAGQLVKTVGLWRDTSAINSISIFVSSGNFATGTTATLYGIKAA